MQEKTQENKYKQGKIYKITDRNFTECYIGSTTQQLSVRFGGHKRDYKCYQATSKRITSFDLFDKFGVENCQILLIETYPCNTKDELRAREAHHIKNTKCVNKCIPGRTVKEYAQEYYVKNKDTIKAYQEQNKESIRECKKQYREKNKEAIRKMHQKYREKNKEALRLKRIQPHICACGGSYTHIHQARHFKTKRHMRYAAAQIPKTVEI